MLCVPIFLLYILEVNIIKQPNNNVKSNNRSGDDIINEDIRAKELLVISQTGEQLGVMTKKAALDEAYNRNMDLVLVAAQSNPPVAKIMDYSKYRYEQQKKLKEIKKNQKIIKIKEIRLSPTIDKHDFETRVKNAGKFLNDGDKVKVTLRFIGRMISHQDVGKQVMERFADALKDVANVESAIKLDGKTMSMVLTAKNN